MPAVSALGRSTRSECGPCAVTPGRDFGLNQPQRHLRFAYTASVERLAEGVKRIRADVPPAIRHNSAIGI